MKLHNRRKRSIAAALCAMLLFAMGGVALAADVKTNDLEITGDTSAIEFDYVSGGLTETSALFDFNNVMPGDSNWATISIDNGNNNDVAYNVYLAVEPTPEQRDSDHAEDFLGQLRVHVYQGNTRLNTGKLVGTDTWPLQSDRDAVEGENPTTGQQDPRYFVPLGRVAAGEELELSVKVEWPLGLRTNGNYVYYTEAEAEKENVSFASLTRVDYNDFQNAVGQIDWIIAVEAISIRPDGPDRPRRTPIPLGPPIVNVDQEPIPLGTPITGDDTNLLYWCVALIALVLVLTVLIVKRRQQHRDQ